MKLKKLPPECIAPFRLKEITLHGIGSYYKPARLEIKPLTILCGTNGSGKSTWMKVLSTVKEALEVVKGKKEKLGELDFLVRLINVFNNNQLLNENLNYREIFTSINDDDWNDYVGPKGSFSISYTCTKPTELTTTADQSNTKWPSILRTQTLQNGDVIRFRFTQCAIRHDDEKKSCFLPAWRLSINGNYIEVYAGQDKYNGKCKHYFRTGIESADARATKDVLQKSVKEADSMVDVFGRLYEQILRLCLTGYFKISAIRNIYDEVTKGKHLASSRYVGESGKYAHFFQRYFGVTPVLDPRKRVSYCGTKSRDDADEYGWKLVYNTVEDTIARLQEKMENYKREGYTWSFHEGFRSPDTDSLFGEQRDWLFFSDSLIDLLRMPSFCEHLYLYHHEDLLTFQKELQKRTHTSGPEISAVLKSVLAFTLKGKGVMIDQKVNFMRTDVRYDFLCAAKEVLEVLRSEILLSPTFYSWFAKEFQKGNLGSGLHRALRILPEWVTFLISFSDSELHPDDRKTLNEWALAWIDFGIMEPIIGLKCAMVFNWWSYKLLGVDVKALRASGYSTRHFVGERNDPVGYLASYSHPELDEFEYPDRPYSNLLLGDLDGGNYSPGVFSAGLHQVFPVLVQMNMMKMNEVLAVENPEVHLHPGLQLKFMGFFIENALIGKFSLIETHSDLMIRRVLRAIHEEKLPQSWVNIFFVDSEQVEGEDVWTSKIERLGLTQQGVVSNWPKGFLDDDVIESEALLRAMYGNSRQTEADDE